MEAPPPPPPPHGANPSGGPKNGGLPDGKYDIFVIPPSSAGSGFLYLPSLQPNRNSFIAGAVCSFLAIVIFNATVPVIKNWFQDTMSGGGSGVWLLVLAVGVVAWALGKTQGESTHTGGTSSSGTGGANFTSQPKEEPQPSGTNVPPNPPPPHSPPPHAPPPQSPPPNSPPPPPKSSWQRPQSTPTPGQKSNWEKAREEVRKREEERKKAEEAKKRAEELEKRKAELEKERQKAREKDARERLERERKERLEKEAKEREAAKEAAAAKAAREAAAAKPASPPKRPPMPSVRTDNDAASDAYSFRPYDRPKHKANSAASMYSESSYAPSQSTARTTPPPTFSGPYTTQDPDKIIIKGAFQFNNAFMRTPVAQLISGQRPVTDGLILRITTEGLFIDDDRREEAQREWDVKAWTMKLAEVWCPKFPRKSQTSTPVDAADSRHPTDDESAMHLMRAIHHCKASCMSPRSSVSIDKYSPLLYAQRVC